MPRPRPYRRLPLALLTLLAACIDTRASERDLLDASTLDAGSDSGKSYSGNDNPDAASDTQTLVVCHAVARLENRRGCLLPTLT